MADTNTPNAAVLKIWADIRNLSREDRIFLAEQLRDNLAATVRRELLPGTKAKFTTKQGAEIIGTILRVNAKSVKISANMDRYGRPTQLPVTWTVSPQLLTPAE